MDPNFRVIKGVDCNLKDNSTKAISKCEVNPTSGFQATAFTSNILYRVQC